MNKPTRAQCGSIFTDWTVGLGVAAVLMALAYAAIPIEAQRVEAEEADLARQETAHSAAAPYTAHKAEPALALYAGTANATKTTPPIAPNAAAGAPSPSAATTESCCDNKGNVKTYEHD